MARRPNYSLNRNERNRAKQAKRDAKLRQRQEIAAERKVAVQSAESPVKAPVD
jgi:hypothetical protein